MRKTQYINQLPAKPIENDTKRLIFNSISRNQTPIYYILDHFIHSPLTNITSLNFVEPLKISNLESLRFCKNLKNLECSFVEIKSLRGIENLRKLKKISLFRCSLENLDALENLVNLKIVDISDNEKLKKKHFRSLKNIKKLEKLYCHPCDPSIFACLPQNDRLRNLNCSHTIFLNHKFLRDIDCRSCKLKSLSVLGNLVHLKCITADYNMIECFGNLTKLKELKHINCQQIDTKFKTFKGLPTNLKTFFVNNIHYPLFDFFDDGPWMEHTREVSGTRKFEILFGDTMMGVYLSWISKISLEFLYEYF